MNIFIYIVACISFCNYQMSQFLFKKTSPRKNSRTNSHGLFDDGERSDESETSSICSERSYPDFGRRSSDGVSNHYN